MMNKISFLITICFYSGFIWAGEEVAKKPIKDTSEAVIFYEDDFERSYLKAKLEKEIVSKELTNERMVVLVDSLLSLEKCPKDLLTYLLEKIETKESSVSEEVVHASELYYHTWNTEIANPYTQEFSEWKLDTTIELTLDTFVMPIVGPITSNFGWRRGRMHNGVDIDLEVWDTLRACFSGTVRVARYYGGYGRAVIIRHDNGLETIYAHLHRIKVESGDRVKAGDFIGFGGSSGHSTGSHLHFEVRFLGKPINPAHIISFDEMAATDTLVVKRVKNSFACFPKGAEYHTVKSGDYLYKIAMQYGTTVNKLCELNSIRRNKMLHVGEKLRII